MKISEQELIEELESLRDDARKTLDRWYRLKLDKNSAGVGIKMGVIDICDHLLKLIKHGFD